MILHKYSPLYPRTTYALFFMCICVWFKLYVQMDNLFQYTYIFNKKNTPYHYKYVCDNLKKTLFSDHVVQRRHEGIHSTSTFCLSGWIHQTDK